VATDAQDAKKETKEVPTYQLSKDLADPFLLESRAQWYKEQSELMSEALWHEIRERVTDVDWTKRQYEERIKELEIEKQALRNPIYFTKKVVKIILRKLRWKFFGRRVSKVSIQEYIQQTGLSFPDVERPIVSVVIPMFNLLDMTLQCLRSLMSVEESVSFEVIVADDASSDALVPKILGKIPGLKYVRRPENGGFVMSCNSGAEKARGKYIFFLNNDAEVQDGWLTESLRLFENAEVGVVGSKLIYPDGRLQEAGGIIFKSAEGWNYGKTDQPDKPEYSYVRDADYVSGAAYMIRTELFREIGGFNKNLAPGYFEDVELSFAVREKGYRVLYQPRSVVTHHEGATSAASEEAGRKPMKDYQEVNYEKFKKMRAIELSKQWEKDLRLLPLIARRTHGKGKRIWVFDWFIPMPDNDYGSVRMLQLLKLLARDHVVTFVSRDLRDRPKYRRVLEDMGIEVIKRFSQTNLDARMQLEGPHIDLAIVSRSEVAHHFWSAIRANFTKAKIIFDTVDVHSVRWQREVEQATTRSERENAGSAQKYFRTLEERYTQESDCVWAITDVDQTAFKEMAPETRVDVVAAAHDILGDVPAYEERAGLFFIGSFHHPPNEQAVKYLVEKVLPLVDDKSQKLSVAGGPLTPWLKSQKDITVLGRVSDERREELLDKARVFACPLLTGSGLKGKIIMALSRGLPVVTTTVGAEGIPHGNEGLLVADNPEEFARLTDQLLTDPEKWARHSQAAQEIVRKHFSQEHFAQSVAASLSATLNLH